MLCTVIEIAGICIEVNHTYDYFQKLSRPYISTDKNIDFSVTVYETDIDFERKKYTEECKYEKIPYRPLNASLLESTAIYRKIAQKLPMFSAIVFHGSAVAVDNNAFIFTAKSGMGKTTHTNLWLKNIKNSFVVNGDKPIIRIFDDGVKVCGTPWCGKENLGTNICVPLKSICILNRGNKNSICKTDFSDAISTLIGQTYRSNDTQVLVDTLKTLENIAKNVELYKLYCNMSDEASIISYNGMKD